MGRKYTGVSPGAYAFSLMFMGIACFAFSTWVWSDFYDWPAINAKLERLTELESKAEVYETMHSAGVGVWCEVAVHYDWLEESDHEAAATIIASGVHED